MKFLPFLIDLFIFLVLGVVFCKWVLPNLIPESWKVMFQIRKEKKMAELEKIRHELDQARQERWNETISSLSKVDPRKTESSSEILDQQKTANKERIKE